MSKMVARVVYVYNHYWVTSGKNRPLAYLGWQGKHACEHIVSVVGGRGNGERAKKAAIKEHLDPGFYCDQTDWYA